jgi:hypothetical protein
MKMYEEIDGGNFYMLFHTIAFLDRPEIHHYRPKSVQTNPTFQKSRTPYCKCKLQKEISRNFREISRVYYYARMLVIYTVLQQHKKNLFFSSFLVLKVHKENFSLRYSDSDLISF